jgi:peptidyl-prolyl isomerase E (cyclophilin E)
VWDLDNCGIGNTQVRYAFVEFEEAEDAAAAIDNMHQSELYGRMLRVTLGKSTKILDGSRRPGISH